MQQVIAVKGVILHNGKALVVKRAADDEVGAGTWEMAGGKLEFGEDLETGLMREIEEETGLQVTVGQILYATSFNTASDRQVIILAYLCHSPSSFVALSAEHEDFCWADAEKLKALLSPAIIEEFNRHAIFSLIEETEKRPV